MMQTELHVANIWIYERGWRKCVGGFRIFLLFSVWFRAINSERMIRKGHAAYKKRREM